DEPEDDGYFAPPKGPVFAPPYEPLPEGVKVPQPADGHKEDWKVEHINLHPELDGQEITVAWFAWAIDMTTEEY
uniref:DNA topoisomerase (Fragments) n=1 Tax=Rattus norvegicus TaxID=10116 RepID=Q7M0H8_RAT